MSKRFAATTVRLTPSLRAILDAAARRAGVTRSEMTRRALTSALVGAPMPPSYIFDTGRADHALRYVLPSVSDSAPEAEKERVATRNAATLAGRCQRCDASVVVADELSARAEAMAPPRIVPSRSEPTARRVLLGQVKPPPPRTTVHALIAHDHNCPAVQTEEGANQP
jgi:hypothetical protein